MLAKMSILTRKKDRHRSRRHACAQKSPCFHKETAVVGQGKRFREQGIQTSFGCYLLAREIPDTQDAQWLQCTVTSGKTCRRMAFQSKRKEDWRCVYERFNGFTQAKVHRTHIEACKKKKISAWSGRSGTLNATIFVRRGGDRCCTPGLLPLSALHSEARSLVVASCLPKTSG